MAQNLPAAGVLGDTDPSHTNADLAAELEETRGFIVEALMGSSARYALTISGGSITPPDGATGGGCNYTVESEASAASDDLTNIVQTNTHDGQLIRLACVNASHVITVKDASGGSGQIILMDGEDFVLDALDKWILLEQRSTTWVEVDRSFGVDYFDRQDFDRVAQLVSHNTLCPHSRLRIDYATAATLTVAADAVVLYDSANHAKRFNSLSETLNIANTGANGRDVVDNAGAEQASVWYHLFAIGKADGTLDVFASQVGYQGSGTSIYTRLPSGYTFAGYIGAARNDASSNLIQFQQRGDEVVRGGQSVLSGGTSTATSPPATVDLSAAVPQSARKARLDVYFLNTSTLDGSIGIYGTAATTYFLVSFLHDSGAHSTVDIRSMFDVLLLTPQTIYYGVNASAVQASITVYGWQF